MTTTNNNNLPLLPVDRQWLRKLLKKHGRPDDEPAIVCAPMVDQSDLPFRLLCREYGVNLCFTPMVHAKLFMNNQKYRQSFTLQHLPSQDRPLIAQICGSDVQTVCACARLLEPYCDGIDLNCGCPQKIAKRGAYGAYLLEQPDILLPVVTALLQTVRVPVSVKVRLLPQTQDQPPGKENHGADEAKTDTKPPKNDNTLAAMNEFAEQGYHEQGCDTTTDDCAAAVVPPEFQPSLEASLRLYRQLVDAGVHMLTIHGRTRHQKGPWTCKADWAAIRLVVQELGDRIPILANGSIASAQEATECLAATGCDGIMSSEGLLEYPPLLQALTMRNHPNTRLPRVGRVELARRYLAYARQYPPDQGGQGSGIKCIRIHIHRFCHADFQDDSPVARRLRDAVVNQTTIEGLADILDQIQAIHDAQGHDVQSEELSWYRRYTEKNERGEYVNVMERRLAQDRMAKASNDTEGEAEAMNMATFFGSANDNEEW